MATGDELVVKSKLPIRLTLRPANGAVLFRILMASRSLCAGGSKLITKATISPANQRRLLEHQGQ